jgi:hypothetical protein
MLPGGGPNCLLLDASTIQGACGREPSGSHLQPAGVFEIHGRLNQPETLELKETMGV